MALDGPDRWLVSLTPGEEPLQHDAAEHVLSLGNRAAAYRPQRSTPKHAFAAATNLIAVYLIGRWLSTYTIADGRRVQPLSLAMVSISFTYAPACVNT